VPAWTLSVLGVAWAASLFWSLPERPGWALAGLVLCQVCDMLDGAVARRAGTASGRGKLVDQTCDAAAFAALALAAGASGLAAGELAAAAAVACTLAVATALARAAHRDPEAFRANPRAGFAAHVPKLAVFLALPTLLAGGPDLLEPALTTAAGLAAVVTVGYLAAEAWAWHRRGAGEASLRPASDAE
jgi:phosphatidylglycerophosphate synthase